MTRHPIAEVRETALESLQPGVTPPLDPYPEGVLSATLERMSDSDYRVVWSAKLTLAAIGHQAKENGDPLWWVVPRVYWRQIMVSLLALAVWFAFWSRRFGRPPGKPFRLGPTSGVPMSEGRARALRVVFVAVPPTVLSAACVRYALSQGWATPTLPEPFLALLPLPTAGALSVSFVCVLLAIWTCRKRSHPTPELPSAGPRPETPRSGPVENNERPEEA
ncbi:MAG: hypothetical protein JKY65_20055 [Planctomycetes bacterium]|nr:hypothetical protein [Planctomycetota bacterium]